MAKKDVDDPQLRELLCQALETEAGGIKIYETALTCVVNEDLKSEWEEYVSRTQRRDQRDEGTS